MQRLRTDAVPQASRRSADPPSAHNELHVLALQRAAGNRAVTQLIQRSLSIKSTTPRQDAGEPAPSLADESEYEAIPSLDVEDNFKRYAPEFLPHIPQALFDEVLTTLVDWSASSQVHYRCESWADAVGRATRASQPRHHVPEERKDIEIDNRAGLEAAIGSTGATSDIKVVMRDVSRKTANCGQAAFSVRTAIERLVADAAKDGASLVPAHSATFAAGQGADLSALLDRVPERDQVLLFDCQYPAVHNFVIETHPDGERYLAQGYQGTYPLEWWLGQETEESQKFFNVPESGANAEMRKEWGLGQDIQKRYPQLLKPLEASLAKSGGGPWTPVVEAWPQLPFNRDDAERQSISHRGGTPTLQVEVFVISGVEAIFKAADAKPGALSKLAMARR